MSERDSISDVSAVYFTMPVLEHVKRICEVRRLIASNLSFG